MSLTKHINDLSDILRKNTELYEEMALELMREQAALRVHSLNELSGSLRRKESIVLKIQTLDETRQMAVDKLAKLTGIDAGEINVSRLIELANGSIKERLASIQTALKAAIERTNEINYFNRGLIEGLMRINYDSAAYLQNLLEPEGTYAKKGLKTAPLKAGRVLSRTL